VEQGDVKMGGLLGLGVVPQVQDDFLHERVLFIIEPLPAK
jgi:hypothetical protein